MSYEKDKLDSFVTSASLSTALAPYVTSASLASALGAIDLSAYVTSNSLSAAIATDALTVRGAAAVSATLSAGAVTVAGKSLSQVLLGYQSIQNVASYSFSGSWSDIVYIEIRASYRMSGTVTPSIAIFTDGGGTAFLSTGGATNLGTIDFYTFEGQVWGVNGVSPKFLQGTWRNSTSGAVVGDISVTANAGVVNCIRISHASKTLSSGTAIAIGWRTS